MTKSDQLHKNDYSENAVEIHQLQARNRTSSKDEVTNIKHGLMLKKSDGTVLSFYCFYCVNDFVLSGLTHISK